MSRNPAVALVGGLPLEMNRMGISDNFFYYVPPLQRWLGLALRSSVWHVLVI